MESVRPLWHVNIAENRTRTGKTTALYFKNPLPQRARWRAETIRTQGYRSKTIPAHLRHSSLTTAALMQIETQSIPTRCANIEILIPSSLTSWTSWRRPSEKWVK